jgi:hypothetical protein
LPTFDGTARQWPRFISAYKYSTRKGPFSPEENTTRLLDFLKGKALSLVEGFLINPSKAEDAMLLLEEWYGDVNEVRIQLKQDVLNLPYPNERDKEKIRDFSAAIRTYVSYLKALPNSRRLLANEDTMLEMLQMLPPGMQARWFEKIDSMKKTPNLADFEEFVSRLARSYRNVMSSDRRVKRDEKSHKGRHHVHLHVSASEDSQSSGIEDSDTEESCSEVNESGLSNSQ